MIAERGQKGEWKKPQWPKKELYGMYNQ